MPRRLDHDELILRWTLVGDELERCRGKRGPSGLAFALVWKFCAQHGRFPRDTGELPDEAVGFVARQLGVDAVELVDRALAPPSSVTGGAGSRPGPGPGPGPG